MLELALSFIAGMCFCVLLRLIISVKKDAHGIVLVTRANEDEDSYRVEIDIPWKEVSEKKHVILTVIKSQK